MIIKRQCSRWKLLTWFSHWIASVKEQSEKVACILSRALGWNETSMPEKNVKLEKTENVIKKKDLEKAQQGNDWDIQLYKRAQELERQTFQSFSRL
jgi:hypothetical protein